MSVLLSLFEFARDLAILAAAIGVARWAWAWSTERAARRDEEAKAALADERFRTDLRQWSTAIADHAGQISARLEAIATLQRDREARRREAETRQRDADTRQPELEVWQREAEARAGLEVRVHELLQSTTDPYLSFIEILQALQPARPTETPTEPAATYQPITATELRRALIELVGRGVVAQLDRDRYFIASDFEAGDGDS